MLLLSTPEPHHRTAWAQAWLSKECCSLPDGAEQGSSRNGVTERQNKVVPSSLQTPPCAYIKKPGATSLSFLLTPIAIQAVLRGIWKLEASGNFSKYWEGNKEVTTAQVINDSSGYKRTRTQTDPTRWPITWPCCLLDHYQQRVQPSPVLVPGKPVLKQQCKLPLFGFIVAENG